MIFVCVRYSFRAEFSMGVESSYIEKGSAESASPESIFLDVRASVIFSSGCFVVKAFALQRLKFGSISTSWHISSRSVAKLSRISLYLR